MRLLYNYYYLMMIINLLVCFVVKGLAPELPSNPMIQLSDGSIFAIPCISTKSRAYNAQSITIRHPNWNNAIEKVVGRIQEELKCKEFRVSVELDQLVVLAGDIQQFKVQASKGIVLFLFRLRTDSKTYQKIHSGSSIGC